MGLNEFAGYVGVALAGVPHRLRGRVAGRAGRSPRLRYGPWLSRARPDSGLGAGHAALGEGRERRAQGGAAEEPAALSERCPGAPTHSRGLRADELARPAALRDLPGRARRVRSSTRSSGRSSRSSSSPGRQLDRGRLDRRHLRFVWGGAQLFTGRLSDHVGRFWPNVLGMWICGAGVAMVVTGTGALWWSVSAGVARAVSRGRCTVRYEAVARRCVDVELPERTFAVQAAKARFRPLY